MSEKIYDSIYKIAKTTESDVVVLWVGHSVIRGILTDCEDNKCIKDILTLQDVSVKCMHNTNMEEKHFKWLNIPSCKIDAFTFKCCVMDD